MSEESGRNTDHEARTDHAARAPGAQPVAEDRTHAPFSDVLCAVDGSAGGYASVEQAAALTGPGGHLTLLAVTSFRSAGAHRPPEKLPHRVKQILDEAVRIADDAGVKTTVDVDPAAPPAGVILEWAAEHDLLAMGAPTTPWLGGVLGGGPAAAAVGELLTPLLVARPRSAPGPIVVASDGLDGSDRLVELADRLAQSHGSALHVLHATRRGPRLRSRSSDHQRATIDRLLAGAGQVRIEPGSARTLILDGAARVGASMVVMSSRRLHGPRTIGSVSRHVVHHADCSVLLIPPERLQG